MLFGRHVMPEITLRCPACNVLLRLKKRPAGKTAMPCPKCSAKVPLPREEEPEEELPAVEGAVEGEEEGIEPALSRSQTIGEEERDDEEPQPRRRKKKNRKAPDDRTHLWPILGGACLGGTLLVFLVFFFLFGTQGLPDPQEGPHFIKYVVLFVFLAVGVGISINGINGVVTQQITIATRTLYIVTEREYTGTNAVLAGYGQCICGAFFMGVSLYGMIFHG
jgi:hypothetical protein